MNAAPSLLAATAAGRGYVAALLGHHVVKSIECQGDNGCLGILQERSHHAGGESALVAPLPGLPPATPSKRGSQYRSDGFICRGAAHLGSIRNMRREYFGIEVLLRCLVSGSRDPAAPSAPVSAGVFLHFLHGGPTKVELASPDVGGSLSPLPHFSHSLSQIWQTQTQPQPVR